MKSNANAIESDFDIISRLNGYLSFDAFDLFCNLYKLSCIPDKPVLEIGVFCGRSLAGIACAFKNVQVVGVDPFYSDFKNSLASPSEAEHLAAASNYMTPEERIKTFWEIIDLLDKKDGTNLKSQVKLERVTQEEFLRERLGTDKYQLCHVDGEHTFQAVKDVLDVLDELLVPDAWFIVDDLLSSGYPEIAEAVFSHSSFRNTVHPVLYAFNKGVFVYRPKSDAYLLQTKEELRKRYDYGSYIILRQRDNAIVVQRHTQKSAPSQKFSMNAFLSLLKALFRISPKTEVEVYKIGKLTSIGKPKWTRDDLKNKLEEFSELYKNIPIQDNYYGMRSPHMFAAWFNIQFLKPECVIESGIWKGQGTWFFEKAAPNAKIHSIDINLGLREYISEKVIYHNIDFFDIDWSGIPKEKTLCFFDDHQNAVERVKFCKRNGFKMLVFEDNYPPGQGDCYSLKHAFAKGGEDADYLKNVLKVYYEFPPVFKSEKTRWGDEWNDEKYPTPEPLYKNLENEYLQVYFDESIHYTWICYAELK